MEYQRTGSVDAEVSSWGRIPASCCGRCRQYSVTQTRSMALMLVHIFLTGRKAAISSASKLRTILMRFYALLRAILQIEPQTLSAPPQYQYSLEVAAWPLLVREGLHCLEKLRCSRKRLTLTSGVPIAALKKIALLPSRDPEQSKTMYTRVRGSQTPIWPNL